MFSSAKASAAQNLGGRVFSGFLKAASSVSNAATSFAAVVSTTPKYFKDYKENFCHAANYAKQSFNINGETIKSATTIFDIANKKYETNCKQQQVPAVAWVKFICSCESWDTEVSKPVISENNKRSESVTNLIEAEKYLSEYNGLNEAENNANKEYIKSIRFVINELWNNSCFEELFCLLALGYINQLGNHALAKDNKGNYVLDVESCKKWLLNYLPEESHAKFNYVQLDSKKFSINLDRDGSCFLVYDDENIEMYEIPSSGILIPYAVDNQIDYLKNKLSCGAQKFFDYFINVREEFTIIKTPFFNKKITVGDFDGCIGRMLLAAIIAGHIMLDKPELDKLAIILEKEYVAFKDDRTSSTDRFKQFQSDKELERLIKEVCSKIVYLSGVCQTLIFLGDGEDDRGSILRPYFIMIKLNIKAMNPTKVVNIRGNHDAKKHVNLILTNTVKALVEGHCKRQEFDSVCACYGAFAHPESDGKSIAVYLEPNLYEEIKKYLEEKSKLVKYEFTGLDKITILRNGGNIIFNFKELTLEEELNEVTKVNAYYDNGKIYTHHGLSTETTGDIKTVPIDTAFGRFVNCSMQVAPRFAVQGDEEGFLYEGDYKDSNNLEQQFELIDNDDNNNRYEEPQIRIFASGLISNSYMEDYIPDVATTIPQGETSTEDAAELIEDDFCIVERSGNPKKTETANFAQKLVDALNKAPIPEQNFGGFRPDEANVSRLSKIVGSIVYGHDGCHNIEPITSSVGYGENQVYRLNPRVEQRVGTDGVGRAIWHIGYQPTLVALD